MDFSEVMNNRYSVRKFTDEEVPRELIDKIVNAGRMAPSAGNYQPTIVYVLDGESIEKLKAAPSAKIHPVVFRAKQALLVCYNKNVEMKRPHDHFEFGITDSTIAATYMMLKITELGLGSVWVGWFHSAIVKEVLGCRRNMRCPLFCPLGIFRKAIAQAPTTRNGSRWRSLGWICVKMSQLSP